MGSVIFVTGFKGGVGKTTVTAGIASCLSVLGKRVLVVDGDFGMRCMDMVLHAESDVLFDCSDLLRGVCEKENAITQINENLYFICAPMHFDGKPIPQSEFTKLFSELREDYDYILIDSGADLTDYYRSFARASDDAIVVSMHQSTSVRAAERTAQLLAGQNLRSMRLVINGYRKKSADSGALPGALEIIRASSLRLLGIVPYDESLQTDQEAGRLAFDDGDNKPASSYEAAFMNIAKRIIGKRVPLFRGVIKTKKRKLYKDEEATT